MKKEIKPKEFPIEDVLEAISLDWAMNVELMGTTFLPKNIETIYNFLYGKEIPMDAMEGLILFNGFESLKAQTNFDPCPEGFHRWDNISNFIENNIEPLKKKHGEMITITPLTDAGIEERRRKILLAAKRKNYPLTGFYI